MVSQVRARDRAYGRSMRLTLLACAAALVLLVPSPVSAAASTDGCMPVVRGVFKSQPIAYRKADVWVYGDSLTYQSYQNLGVRRVATDAYFGRSTSMAVDHLAADMAAYRHNPKIVVMAVGTNDREQPDVFAAQVRRALSLIPRKVRVIWVNVYAEIGAPWGPINAVLYQRPRIRPVYWAAARRPEYFIDGIHLTRWGCLARNALIRKSLLRAGAVEKRDRLAR